MLAHKSFSCPSRLLPASGIYKFSSGNLWPSNQWKFKDNYFYIYKVFLSSDLLLVLIILYFFYGWKGHMWLFVTKISSLKSVAYFYIIVQLSLPQRRVRKVDVLYSFRNGDLWITFLRQYLKIFVFVENILILEIMLSHHAIKCCIPGMQKSLFDFTFCA